MVALPVRPYGDDVGRKVTPFETAEVLDLWAQGETVEAQGVAAERGSTKALAEIIKRGTRISVADMAKIAASAEAAGGRLVAMEPDGDWCGTGHVHIPWPPPKKNELLNLLDLLVAEYINHEILINGIPAPDHIIINISRQIGLRAAVGH